MLFIRVEWLTLIFGYIRNLTF